jgi:hypothetical protein
VRVETEMVRCVPLDEWIASQSISKLDLIKLNAEGMELEVLRGAQKIFAQYNPDLIIKWSPNSPAGTGQATASELYKVLSQKWKNLYYVEGPQSDAFRTISSLEDLMRVAGSNSGPAVLYCTSAALN